MPNHCFISDKTEQWTETQWVSCCLRFSTCLSQTGVGRLKFSSFPKWVFVLALITAFTSCFRHSLFRALTGKVLWARLPLVFCCRCSFVRLGNVEWLTRYCTFFENVSCIHTSNLLHQKSPVSTPPGLPRLMLLNSHLHASRHVHQCLANFKTCDGKKSWW